MESPFTPKRQKKSQFPEDIDEIFEGDSTPVYGDNDKSKNEMTMLNQRIKFAKKALNGEFDFAVSMREDLVEIMRSELKEVKNALAKEREHKRDRAGVRRITK